MTTSLKKLERKKLETGLNRLAKAGINIPRWLAMVDSDEAAMKRLEAAWPIFITPYSYDAVHILGFGSASEEAMPEAKSGEVIIRYGGWSLQELRDSVNGKKWMHQQDWYNSYGWSTEKLPAGIYRLRVPVPVSSGQTFVQQQEMLSAGEEVAPVVLVATALLAHHLQKGKDPLNGDWTRCKEVADDDRVELVWDGGRLVVGSGWDDDAGDGVWLSSVRTS